IAYMPPTPAAERDDGQPRLACIAEYSGHLFVGARLDNSLRADAVDRVPLRVIRRVSVLVANNATQVIENGCLSDQVSCPTRRRPRRPWRSPLSFATRPRRSLSRSGRPCPG